MVGNPTIVSALTGVSTDEALRALSIVSMATPGQFIMQLLKTKPAAQLVVWEPLSQRIYATGDSTEKDTLLAIVREENHTPGEYYRAKPQAGQYAVSLLWELVSKSANWPFADSVMDYFCNAFTKRSAGVFIDKLNTLAGGSGLLIALDQFGGTVEGWLSYSPATVAGELAALSPSSEMVCYQLEPAANALLVFEGGLT